MNTLFKGKINKLMFSLVVGTLFWGFASVCFAASTGLSWDTVLTTLQTEFTNPIPKIMGVVFVATSGIMLAFGETGGMFKKSLQIVLGLGLAITTTTWLAAFVDYTADSSSAIPTATLPSSMTGTDFVSGFMNYFISSCMIGAYKIQSTSLTLLLILATIETALTLSFNYEQDHIKYVFKQVLTVGFFAFLIKNWVGGSFGIADNIFTSFEVLGLKAAGAAMANPDNIINNTITIVSTLWNTILDCSMGSMGFMIGMTVVMVFIILTTFLMAIEIFVCKVEFWVISTLSIPLIPFGVNKHTKFLFEKVIGAVFSMGIKLMVLSFVAALGITVIQTMAKTIAADTTASTTLPIALRMVLACAVVYMLTKKAPDLAQSLLSGSPSLGGSDGMNAMKGMASMAMKPASAAIAAGGFARAASIMPGGGSTSDGSTKGTLKNMGKLALANIAQPFSNKVGGHLYKMDRARNAFGSPNENKSSSDNASKSGNKDEQTEKDKAGVQ